MTKVLGKEDLLQNNLKRELVHIDALEADVWMSEMTAGQTIEFKEFIDSFKAAGVVKTSLAQDIEIMSLITAFSVCDENGTLLFTRDEATKLKNNNLSALMELGTKAMQVSGVMVAKTKNDEVVGLTSEVAANLPKDQMKSLSENSHKSSRKRGKKS